MSKDPRDGLFLKIGPFQAAAYGRLAVVLLTALVTGYWIGRGIGWW